MHPFLEERERGTRGIFFLHSVNICLSLTYHSLLSYLLLPLSPLFIHFSPSSLHPLLSFFSSIPFTSFYKYFLFIFFFSLSLFSSLPSTCILTFLYIFFRQLFCFSFILSFSISISLCICLSLYLSISL